MIICATLGAAHAHSEWYGSFGLGWQDARPMKLDALDATIDYDFRARSPALALGRTVGDNWRMELEASYRENKGESIYFHGDQTHVDPAADDKATATAFMFSAMRDFSLGIGFEPYLGAGLGIASVSVQASENDERDPGTGVTFLDDSGAAFAYQLMAGVNIPITRRFDLAIDYRYWRALSAKLTDELGDSQDVDYATNSVWLHMRYRPQRQVTEDWWRRPEPEQRGFYLSGSLGAGRPADAEMKNIFTDLDAFAIGPVTTLAAGMSVGRRWRVELEAARRKNEMQVIDFGFIRGERLTDGDARADSLMLNAVYRFRPEAKIRPTAMVGVGATKVRYDIKLQLTDEPFLDDRASGTAIQWGLGLEFAATKHVTVGLDYRMWVADGLKLETASGDSVDPSHEVHSASFGVRYTF